MRNILSRKERQLEKLEIAASEGLNMVVLQLYPSEAKRWEKKGFQVTENNSEKRPGIYTISFNFPTLLNSAEMKLFFTKKSAIPKSINYAQRLYIISQQAIFEQSFMD